MNIGQGVVLVAADLDFIRSPLTLVLAALAGSVAILVTVASAVAIIYQLRANAANYSPQSYRQHVQLIRLVILQVLMHCEQKNHIKFR
jgi:hypothetical protein